MVNSRIIEILKTFSKNDIKKFRSFLNSPYHTKNKKALSLFEYLIKYYPGFDHINLSKEKIFYSITKDSGENKTFSDAILRNIFSDLILIAEEFLSYEGFGRDKFSMTEKLLLESCSRNIVSVFENTMRAAESQLDKISFDGESHFYRKSIIEDLKLEFSRKNDDLKLYKKNHLGNSSVYLASFFLIRVIKSINLIAFRNQYNIKGNVNMESEIIDSINKTEFLENLKKMSLNDYSLMKIYFRLFESISEPDDDKKYFEFRDSFYADIDLFSELEKYSLFIYLSNICVMKIDMRKEQFKKECFSVYKEMYGRDLFSVMPGFFPVSLFTSVVSTGISSGDNDFVKEFIEKYSPCLNPDHENDAVNYFNALIKFNEGDFRKALELTSRTETGFSNFKYLLKVIEMKCFYEIRDFEQVYYTADSFLHFLNNSKYVDEIYRTEFKKFIKLIDLMINYQFDKKENILYKIEKIFSAEYLSNRTWFKKKLTEIDNRFGSL
ncbi:MAG: hypothetical protein JSS91_02620 [Bacteroidetes bacterium]|nr:hypothetical protein [Bacteroidota bacterium]